MPIKSTASKFKPSFSLCSRCQAKIKIGFAARAAGASFAAPEKFAHFAFADRDLTESGLRKLFPSKGEWYVAYWCPSCELYSVDLSKTYDRVESNLIAKSILEALDEP